MPLLTNSLNSLISAGNDSYSNLYRMTFSGGLLPEDTQNLTVRCSGFTPPTPSQKTYPVKYVTASIDRPVPKVDITRNFSLDFRLDDYWNVYSILLNQQKVTMQASKSFVDSSITSLMPYLFNVKVDRITSLDDSRDDNLQRLFNYKGCWIESITPSGFDTSGSDPVTCSCSINFLEFEDLQSGLTDTNSDSDNANTEPMDSYNYTSYV